MADGVMWWRVRKLLLSTPSASALVVSQHRCLANAVLPVYRVVCVHGLIFQGALRARQQLQRSDAGRLPVSLTMHTSRFIACVPLCLDSTLRGILGEHERSRPSKVSDCPGNPSCWLTCGRGRCNTARISKPPRKPGTRDSCSTLWRGKLCTECPVLRSPQSWIVLLQGVTRFLG